MLIANPRRSDGGILARLPDGFYVPLVGATGGDGTDNIPAGITVIQVTKQYDGIADAPKYVGNVVADANAAMGFYYLHRDYYQNVQLDVTGPDNPGVPDGEVTQEDLDMLEQMQDQYSVTYSADGVADVLVLTPVGQLPLTRPLLDAFVPAAVVAAWDPILRAIIEAGYDRPQPGETYPSQPVPFDPLPASPADAPPVPADQSAELFARAIEPNQPDAVQLGEATASPPGLRTSEVAVAEEPASSAPATMSNHAGTVVDETNTAPVIDETAAQSVLADEETNEPPKRQPAWRTANKPVPSLRGTNRPSPTGDTTAADALETPSSTATADSSTESGSSRGTPAAADATSGTKRSGISVRTFPRRTRTFTRLENFETSLAP